MTSPYTLYFETLIIDNNMYNDNDLKLLFDLFIPLGIKNFLFLLDFNFEYNSLTLQKQKIKDFEERLRKYLKYGIHAKVYNKLLIVQGCAFNKDFKRLYVNKKQSSLFVQYPFFSDTVRYELANDINKMLYHHKCYPMFTNFEDVMNTSSKDTYAKFFDIKSFMFSFDLNYIISQNQVQFVKEIIDKKILVLPSISHSIGNYAGVEKDVKMFSDRIGRKQYLNLCFLFSKAYGKF